MIKLILTTHLCFVCDITSKVSANNAVPGGVIFFVEFSLDKGCDILFNVVLFHGLGSAIDSVLLHFLRHIGILDDGLSLRHLLNKQKPS